MIIGLTGKARSGKDTVATYITANADYEHYWFSKPLKEAAAVYFDMPLEWCYDEHKDTRVVQPWNKTVRELLQKFGTECTRDVFGDDFWIRHANKHVLQNPNLVISDVRFNNEAEFVLNNNGIIINIVRNVDIKLCTHASEQGINPSLATFNIHNTGTIVDLYNNVSKCLQSVAQSFSIAL